MHRRNLAFTVAAVIAAICLVVAVVERVIRFATSP
jgi:hypothetical protein